MTMGPRTVPVDPFDLVVFGVTGDLTKRKLLPALFRRWRAGQVPSQSRIIGAARTDLGDAGFKTFAREALGEFASDATADAAALDAFLEILRFARLDASDAESWGDLVRIVGECSGRVRAFYLSVAPALFAPLAKRLSDLGFAGPLDRIVVEKPLGRDLETAQRLNRQLSECFAESQIYRIDHYLGKETVQNMMALRFANALFEPLWNSNHVDHVQITVAESIGVGGRGGYYDQAGAMRDMVQNHLIQLLCLTAMEPPYRFEPQAVRDEKLKILKALEPMTPAAVANDTARGQYWAGGGMASYLDESGNPDSTTETYVAVKARIANWRWSGTAFYLRTGKRLRARVSEIAVIFKDTPHSIFPREIGSYRGNALIIRLQPDEGITLRMTIKEPGPGGMRLIEVPLDMTFAERLGPAGQSIPDAYERLLMDVIRGDQTLFMRGDEVEAAWAWTDPIIQAWEQSGRAPQPYDTGGSGPEDALMLMHRDGRRWREIST